MVERHLQIQYIPHLVLNLGLLYYQVSPFSRLKAQLLNQTSERDRYFGADVNGPHYRRVQQSTSLSF